MADDYVQEACFYLSELGMSDEEIAKEFSLTEEQVRNICALFKNRIQKGEVRHEEETKDFWRRQMRESSGDFRITLVDDRGGYYHGWKSELEAMDSDQLMKVLLLNKQYSDSHPLSEFSRGEAVIGYDPLVPLRDIRRSVSLIEEILERREDQEETKNK